MSDEITRMAEVRDWCHKRSGGLDSRDICILTVHAEDIAAELYRAGPYTVREQGLRKHLVRRQWVTFMGPDYDGGGTETRYRPPGCR